MKPQCDIVEPGGKSEFDPGSAAFEAFTPQCVFCSFSKIVVMKILRRVVGLGSKSLLRRPS